MIKCKDFLTGGVKSDKPARKLGKLLSRLLMLSLLVSSCTDDDVTGSGNVPLQVSVTANSPLVSRAIVTDEYLPDGSNIGVSLFAADGSSYDNQNYSNVKYTAAGMGDEQTWIGAADVSLSGNPATVVAYYPWQEGVDLTAVPVETATQTDYMWAETLTGVANTNPGVELVMNHALTAVRVKLVLGDYTGDVSVSGISVASPALGTAASLDVLGGEGALADITGQGDAVFFDVDFDLTAEGTSTDVMLVPDESVTSGKTVVAATIGSKKFAAGIPFDEAYKQGYVYTYTITLNNKGFEVTKVAVTPWEDGGLKEAEFEPEKDDTYVVKIVASYEVTAPASLIEGEDVAYNNNISTVQSRSGDTFGFHHNIQGFIGTVDWGDGTKSTYDEETYNSITHVYPNDGKEYIITAKGTIHRLEMGEMVFQQCLKEIIHIGADCGITSFEKSFWGCVNLTTIPEGLFNKCTEVTSFAGTFAYCPGLKALPEGLFDKCTKVTSFYRTFAFCQNLQTVPVGLFDKCTKVMDFRDTFQECNALTGESPYTLIDGVKVHLYERSNYPEYFTEPTDYGMCFSYCTNLTDYGSIPSGWK